MHRYFFVTCDALLITDDISYQANAAWCFRFLTLVRLVIPTYVLKF